MYVLIMNDESIATTKAINHIGELFLNEIEITEEQYEEMNEFPLKLTIENGKVVGWEKTEIEYEPVELEK